MTPLATAPPAKADVLDLIIDPIIEPLQAAVTGLDTLLGIGPAAGSAGLDSLAGLDLGSSAAEGAASSGGSIDALLGIHASLVPDAAGAATTANPFVTAVQNLEQDWINARLVSRLTARSMPGLRTRFPPRITAAPAGSSVTALTELRAAR